MNNNLYKKYYPLITEEDKTSFINSNYSELLYLIGNMNHMVKNEIAVRQYDYISKMKKTTSFFGNPKYKNIAHNEVISHKMSKDKNIDFLSNKLPILESLQYNLVNGCIEDISIEDLNHILKRTNILHKQNICTLILFTMVVVLLLIWIIL